MNSAKHYEGSVPLIEWLKASWQWLSVLLVYVPLVLLGLIVVPLSILTSRKQLNYSNSPPSLIVSFDKELIFDDEFFVINFYGEKSEGEFPVTDFIPDEFEIFNISDGGVAYDEDGYYAIEWDNVTGEFKCQCAHNLWQGCGPHPAPEWPDSRGVVWPEN